MSKRIDPLVDAIYKNDMDGVKSLLSAGAELECRDRAGRTPLINAVIDERQQIARLLIEAGADTNASDKEGLTALHFAAMWQSVEVTKLLISSGAIVDAKDKFGNTPLGRAVYSSDGRDDVVRELLAAGANCDAENDGGVSPRSLASTIANIDMRAILRAMGEG